MGRGRGRGLGFGSIFVLLMAAAAILGTVYFVTRVAGDSPAAAMSIQELFGAVEGAIGPTPSPRP